MTSAVIDVNRQTQTLYCIGRWTLAHLQDIKTLLTANSRDFSGSIAINGEQLQQLDSAGALLLHEHMQAWADEGLNVTLDGFQEEHLALLSLVEANEERISQPVEKEHHPWLYCFGKKTAEGLLQTLSLLNFVGEVSLRTLALFIHPKRLRLRILLHQLEIIGFRALNIVGLLSFLIGVVLAYQMGDQLQTYGATLYLADLLGMAQLREFGPLLTAIIVAGRTGSAFTAQLGLMKINQEVDAIKTLGISPLDMLVLPRVLALLIALPLLTVWADVLGIFGGMIMSKALFGLTPADFLQRFQEAISLRIFLLGLVKTPFYAAIIAMVGCYHGLQVSGSATSAGQQTTLSVVRSIFMIILMDGIFSIIFSGFGV